MDKEAESVSVIAWVEEEEIPDGSVAFGGLGGWVKNGERWEDYISKVNDEYKPRYEAVRKSMIENRIRRGGDWHQESGVPVLSDETHGYWSYRAWGDLCACVWATEDGRDYTYMDFYMDGWGALEDPTENG